MTKKIRKTATATVRFDEEDRKIIDSLKKRLGVSTDSQILRMGIRSLEREMDAVVARKSR